MLGRTRASGASCDPACGSASCGFDGCGAAWTTGATTWGSSPLATPAYGPGEPSYAQGLADVAAYLDALHLTTRSPLGGGAVLPVDAFFDFDVAPRLGDGAVEAGAFEAR